MSKKLSRKTNAWAALFHGGAVEFHPSKAAALASLATGHGGTVAKVVFDTPEFRAQRAVVKAAVRIDSARRAPGFAEGSPACIEKVFRAQAAQARAVAKYLKVRR